MLFTLNAAAVCELSHGLNRIDVDKRPSTNDDHGRECHMMLGSMSNGFYMYCADAARLWNDGIPGKTNDLLRQDVAKGADLLALCQDNLERLAFDPDVSPRNLRG